jgi:hypothetical protein
MKDIGTIGKIGVVSCLVVAACFGFATQLEPTIVENIIDEEPTTEEMEWLPIIMLPLGDNPKPGTEYGWICFNVTSLDNFDFSTNVSNVSDISVFAGTHVNQSTGGETVNHSTPFELSLLIMLNETWEDSDGTFQKDYLRCWVNCTDTTPAISTELATIYNVTADGTGHYWVYAVVDNSGSGYTITDGQHVDSVVWQFEGYYVAGTL